MNLGEFIIKIGTKGDTKELQKTIKQLETAEKKYRRYVKMQQELAKATTDEQKAQIKASYTRQEQIDKLKDAESAQKNLTSSMSGAIRTGLTMLTTISGMVIALDRLGNSLLKNNQLYTTFNLQTGISIGRLNRIAGVAKLSGMNMSAEGVAADLQSLQQKFLNLRLTGQGAGTFAMLGINPMGMKSDQFILALRQRLKGASEEQRSYFLNQLGVSQEWLNVLNLTDEEFSSFLKQSKELQLTEEERKQLARYTLLQQKNNMRFEYARQKLLLAAMPLVQDIMDAVSKIALKIADIFEKNPVWLRAVKDILLLLAGSSVLKTIKAISGLLGASLVGGGGSLFKNIGRFGAAAGTGALGRFVGRQVAKKGALAAVGWAGGPVIGTILSIASVLWLAYDLIKPFFTGENEKDKEEPDPVDITAGGHYYKNINTNMTNNFNNNPQPVSTVEQNLYALLGRYEASITR